MRANQDRLENWHVLQELAGVFDKKPAAKSEKAAAPTGGNGHTEKVNIGSKIKYFDGSNWITGKIESLGPACLALDDNTEIRVPGEVLRQALQDGVVVVD